MTATRPADVDELVRWMVVKGATSGEISDALRQAGYPLGRAWVSGRVSQMGLSLAKRPSDRLRVTGWPRPSGVFTLRPKRITAQLHRLAESADQRGGLTLTEYERAKARILEGE